MTNVPDACDAASCSDDPTYEVAYTETSPHSYRWLCHEHMTMESIHDPVNTHVATDPWDENL